MQKSEERQPQNRHLPKTEDILHNFYAGIFGDMGKLIARHQTFGNWAIGGIPHLQPVPTQMELGLWYAEGGIPGFEIPGAIGLVLLPNELRFGVFLPLDALYQEGSAGYLEDLVDQAYDGRKSAIIRRQSDRILFDRILTDHPPFDVTTMCEAMENPGSSAWQFIVQRLAYIVTTLWVNTLRVLYANSRVGSGMFLVKTKSPLNPDVVIGLDAGVFVHTAPSPGGEGHLTYLRAKATPERIVAVLTEKGIPKPDILSCLAVQEETA